MIKAVVLAAGNGTRMKSELPKVLHQIAEMPLLEHVLLELSQVNSVKNLTVVANEALAANPIFITLRDKYKFDTVIQKQQGGTAHALMTALAADRANYDDIIVTCADTPLLRAATFSHLIVEHAQHENQATCVCFRPEVPHGYGRVKLDAKGNIAAIIEQKSLSEEQQEISLCNAGIMALSYKGLKSNLSKITPDSITKELYLTDIYQIINDAGGKCGKIITAASEVLGINTRQQLAEADKIMQREIVARLVTDGAQVMHPDSSYFARDLQVSDGVVLYPNVYIGQGVKLGQNSVIHSFSWLKQCDIGPQNSIGPFARIRPETFTSHDVHIGNFVEVKKSSIGARTKASHLSYIGDATVEADVNVGAGTVFCNYDGKKKHHTNVGEGSFIGSNSSLIAPVKIAKGTLVAAGSVITKDTQPNTIAINRAHPQKSLKRK